MSYALVEEGIINAVGGLPRSARRLDNDDWVMNLREASINLQEDCGYFPIIDTARPSDTATTTFDRTVEMVGVDPTVVWTERNKTVEELSSDNNETNRSDIEIKLRNDIITLKTQIVDLQADIDTLTVLIDATQPDIDDAQAVIDHTGGNTASAHTEIVKLARLVKGLVQADRTVQRQIKSLKRDVLQQARGDNRLTRIVVGSDLLDDTEGT